MPSTAPAADGSSPKQQKFSSAPDLYIDPTKRYTAEVVTSKGTLIIALPDLDRPGNGLELKRQDAERYAAA